MLFGGIRPLFGGAMSITLQVSVDRTVATDVYDTVVARQATDDTQITAESIAGAPSLAVHAFEERDCVDHEWPGTKCFGVLVRNGDDAAATMHLFSADGEDAASYPLDEFMRDWCTGLYRVPDVRQSAAGEEGVGLFEEGVGSALDGLAAVALAGELSPPLGQASAVGREDGLSGLEEEAVEGSETSQASAAAQEVTEAGQVTIMLKTASGSHFSVVVKPSDTIREVKDYLHENRDRWFSGNHSSCSSIYGNTAELYLVWTETTGCSITDLLDDRTVASYIQGRDGQPTDQLGTDDRPIMVIYRRIAEGGGSSSSSSGGGGGGDGSSGSGTGSGSSSPEVRRSEEAPHSRRGRLRRSSA